VSTVGLKPIPAISALSARLTRPRIRSHALLLAICLCGTIVLDYSSSGIFDRAGNIKFQDFLQFPISARLIANGHPDQLYDDQILARGIRAIAGGDTHVYLQYFYGPQVAILFIPLVSLPFLTQAAICASLSVAIYFASVFLIWKQCPALRPHLALVALCAVAYPPLFHFFVRGQLSAVVLACFTAAYLAFVRHRNLLAGVALGFLVFKPQFVIAVLLVFLLSGAWRALFGLCISASAQLALTSMYFGRTVMDAYLARLAHSGSHPASTELAFSAIQMHSLHSFWEILIPWRPAIWGLYLLSSFAIIVTAAAIWKSAAPLSLRFSALLLAAVLTNPHLYIYDLLALAPVFLMLSNWCLQNSEHPSKPALALLLYFAFLLPLFGPIARWTHLQLSVIVFAAALWTLYRIATVSSQLARHECAVV
jgi:alpha-1,2-mannosyltransferase